MTVMKSTNQIKICFNTSQPTAIYQNLPALLDVYSSLQVLCFTTGFVTVAPIESSTKRSRTSFSTRLAVCRSAATILMTSPLLKLGSLSVSAAAVISATALFSSPSSSPLSKKYLTSCVSSSNGFSCLRFSRYSYLRILSAV